jgi:oligopeptide/dipeptide ABC transporter ATP-binding protein
VSVNVNIVEVKSLYKSYTKSKPTKYAVHNVSLGIEHGEILGLVGESGCGKSTLGALMLKLIEPTKGEIWFDGKNITNLTFRNMRKIRSHMQIVFQGSSNAFNPYHTVRQIISEPMDNYTKFSSAEKERKILACLESVGLGAEHIERYSGELSGGQRQRIGIARALILDPKFVVCDEAVSSVDYGLKKQILKILYDLKQEKGFTYLFISHDMAAINAVCDRVAVMYLGNLVEILPSTDATALHPYTKALMAATLEPDPKIKKKKLVLFNESGDFSYPHGGCPFQSRCLYASEKCRTEDQLLREISDGHFVACHLI